MQKRKLNYPQYKLKVIIKIEVLKADNAILLKEKDNENAQRLKELEKRVKIIDLLITFDPIQNANIVKNILNRNSNTNE